MAPSGVPILRPPANALPPGIEWQATQSAARAKYSPPPSGGLTLSAARDVPPAQSKISPQKIALETIFTSQPLSKCRSTLLSTDARNQRAAPGLDWECSSPRR